MWVLQLMLTRKPFVVIMFPWKPFLMKAKHKGDIEMKKILVINSHPDGTDGTNSVTVQMCHKFLEEYGRHHPNDTVEVINLHEKEVPFLTGKEILPGYDFASDPRFDFGRQFRAYDKYVFVVPIWGFFASAILKAYLELISMPGLLFDLGPEGFIPNMENVEAKKAVFIAASGGDNKQNIDGAWETYLKSTLGLFGITNTATLFIEKTGGKDKKIVVEDVGYPKTIQFRNRLFIIKS